MTSLNGDGPGSFRAALAAAGPVLVVFEVGGVIDLRGRSLSIRTPYTLVAGETAPDPGITIVRGGLVVETHHVTVRHIAVRPGDNGRVPGARWEPDAVSAVRTPASPVHSVVFENVSATWGVDENASVSGPADADSQGSQDETAHDVEFRNCLFAEALSRSTHSKGEHSKGLLVHDGVRGVSIVGNLFAHNRERNPRLKGGVSAVVSGNLVYNWGSQIVGVGRIGNRKTLSGESSSIVGNVAIAGPDSEGRAVVRSVDRGARSFVAASAVFGARKAFDEVDSGVVRMAEPPAGVTLGPIDPRTTIESVLRRAGSRPGRRDMIDARIVRSVIDGSGTIIDSQEAVGGYPVRAETRRPLAVPEGVAERREWLESLRSDLDFDALVDATALLKRLGLNASRLPPTPTRDDAGSIAPSPLDRPAPVDARSARRHSPRF